MHNLLFLLLLVPSLGLAEPLRVFSSVAPIQTLVQRIGGQHVDARVMVRPGFSPHTYSPTPQQVKMLAGSALYVRAGMPFEKAWMDRIRSANPDMPVLDAWAGITLRAMDVHGNHDHGHATEHHQKPVRDQADQVTQPNDQNHSDVKELDPHVWTNPLLVIKMLQRVRDKLSELAPEHTTEFALNHDRLVAEVRGLDEDLKRLLAPLQNRKFMVFHPAWGYFSDRYGFTQVPIEHQGKSPGARALAALIEQARRERIKVIFVQPQFDKRQAGQVAQAIDGVVVAVDPLAADYINNLRRVGHQFVQALQP